MDIQHIKAFIAVAEELHFGRAAEKLHMAQPPVSRSIQQLEAELGTRLFERTTRQVTLTSAGESLLEPARAVIDAERLARLAVAASGVGEVGRVRAAFAGASTYAIVGRLARELKYQHPGIQLELFSQNFAGPAMDRLLSGEMDLCFGRWDIVPGGVAVKVIQDDHLVIAVPASHSLADAREAELSAFAGEKFVSLPPYAGSVLTDRLRKLSHAAGFAADVAQIVPDTWTALAMVGAGIGCTLTVASVAENVIDPHVRFVRVTDASESVALRMAWRQASGNRAMQSVLSVADLAFPLTAQVGESAQETIRS